MQLVDSHCHINFEPLAGDMAGLLARAAEKRSRAYALRMRES